MNLRRATYVIGLITCSGTGSTGAGVMAPLDFVAATSCSVGGGLEGGDDTWFLGSVGTTTDPFGMCADARLLEGTIAGVIDGLAVLHLINT